jgi:hypothetical protein
MNLLKPRHARWMEFLSQFQFKIVHIAGASNVVADFLLRSFEFQSQKIQDIFLNSNQDGSLTVNINATAIFIFLLNKIKATDLFIYSLLKVI